MTSDAASLKAQMRRVGQVKAQDAAAALAEHLKRSIGERVEAGILASQQVLDAAAGSSLPSRDDEAEVMARVAAHLKALQARGHG